MPLVTASRFPALFAQPSNRGLTEGINSAFGHVSNAMIQNKIMEAQSAKEAAIKAEDTKARMFGFYRSLEDGDDQRAAIMRGARQAHSLGLPLDDYMEALAIPNKDERGLFLSQVATRSGLEPVKGVAVGKDQQIRNPYTGEPMGPAPAPGYKYVNAHSIGDGMFSAAWVPEEPGSGLEVELSGKPFEKKAMVEIDNRDFKIPPNFKPNPNHGKVSKEYPQGDPREVVPIVGGPEDATKPQSAEAAKVGEISRAGLDAANKLQAMLKSGDITQDTLLAAAAPDFLNVFKSANVQEFQVYRNDLTDMIGRMRSGGAINKDEEATFLGFLPIHGDKPAVMDIKLERLAEMFKSIGNRINPSQKPSGALTPEEEAELKALRKEFSQ